MEELHLFVQCVADINQALGMLKVKNSYNWYLLKFRKMELELLQMEETEAVNTAGEIIKGSMMYIRGNREAQVSEIREAAAFVLEFGSRHIKEEAIPLRELPELSNIVRTYLHWCQIQYLYFTDEREKALSLALPYLEDQQTMNIYMAYIKVVSSIILLHDNREDEAAVFMQEANKYLNNFQLDYPKLLKQELSYSEGLFNGGGF